jgi:hypothetical protein
MIVLTRVHMCVERASFVLRIGSLSALMVSLELAQSVSISRAFRNPDKQIRCELKLFPRCPGKILLHWVSLAGVGSVRELLWRVTKYSLFPFLTTEFLQ